MSYYDLRNRDKEYNSHKNKNYGINPTILDFRPYDSSKDVARKTDSEKKSDLERMIGKFR